MTGEPGADDQISEETRLMVTQIRARAALAPDAAELAGLLTAAGARGSGLSAGEIRALSRDTIALAGQVSFLLGKLAGILGDDEGGEMA